MESFVPRNIKNQIGLPQCRIPSYVITNYIACLRESRDLVYLFYGCMYLHSQNF